MAVLAAVWGFLRFILAWGGMILVVVSILSLLDIFSVTINGEEVTR